MDDTLVGKVTISASLRKINFLTVLEQALLIDLYFKNMQSALYFIIIGSVIITNYKCQWTWTKFPK